MPHYPEPLRRLIEAFMVLPGIGRKTAERFAFSLLQGKAEAASDLASAITELREHIMVCQECGQVS